MRTVKEEMRRAKTGSTEGIDIAMRTTRARKSREEIGLETRVMDMTSEIWRVDMEEMMDTTTAMTKGTSNAGRTGSMASRAGMRAVRLLRAAQLYDR